MGEHHSDQPFPRGALLGAGALVGFALLSVVAARVSGVGTTGFAEVSRVETRALTFEDRADGAVLVHAAGDGRLVRVLSPGTHGFVRGVLRGFARDRKLRHLNHEPPFELIRWADGRLSLEDPSTGRGVDFGPFGATNVEAFARLLDDTGAAQ
jgi:putative photosynthetic complex assembly protein